MINYATILDYTIVNEKIEKVARELCEKIDTNCTESIVFLNPHSIVLAESDTNFRESLRKASYIFCDGVGLYWASFILTSAKVQRVYGYEFFIAFSKELSSRKIGRVFFLGGNNDLLAELTRRYKEEFSGISSISSFAPPFKSDFTADDLAEMANKIAAFKPDMLWIGVGSPKQEKLLYKLSRFGGFTYGAAIGAVFDFYTDRVPHAPALVRTLGLQWVHRLILEPKRLWRRTFISGPWFLWIVIRKFVGNHR